MPSPPVRFSQLRWLHSAACIISIIGALVLIGLSLVKMGESPNVWMFAAGGLWLFLSVMQMASMPLLVKMESTLARQLSELRDLGEILTKQTKHIEAIAENTRISDAAKSLTHREQEIDAVRSAIREDVRLEKWEAALKLIDDMEHRFGYRQEAEALREELDDARNEEIQAKLAEAIKIIEAHFAAHDWTLAQREIDRLLNALPDEVRVQSLVDRMKSLKEQHKTELLREWEEAIRRSDTDHAIDVLKTLDQYLSPAEAQSIQDSARDVFKEKLLQLGIQFRFAVNEKRWQDALDTGVVIVREFPNARMAGEVREAIDTLRDRARQSAEPAM